MTMQRISRFATRTIAGPRGYTLAIVLILAVGVLLRSVQFGELPPGLYHDEAWYGLDAVETLDQGWKIFYPNNFGREPLNIWLIALSIRFLGVSPVAVRLPALVLGILTLPACYLMTEAFFGRRTAMWALAIMAFTLWPIQLSRIGFRVVSLPPFIGFTLWQAAKGYRTGRLRHWAAGGLFGGIAFYTYSAVRFTPIAAAVFLFYLVVTKRSRLDRKRLAGIAVFVAACAAVILPLAVYATIHLEEFLVRMRQVSLLNPGLSPDEPGVRFARSLVRTLGMFHIRGDHLERHNVPYRPVFDVVMGIALLLGLYECIKSFQRARYAFVVIWVGVMLGPTLLTDDAPHFLRAVGVWPVLASLPALGLDWVWRLVKQRLNADWAWRLVVGGVLLSLLMTTHAYFVRYDRMETVLYRFDTAGLQLTHEVNTFLGRGWTRGDRWVRPQVSSPDRRVYVELPLWEDWLNAHLLVPSSRNFIVPDSYDRQGVIDHASVPTEIYSCWHPVSLGSWLSNMDWLPHNAWIEMRRGPLAITRTVPEPHLAYIVFTATPYETAPPSLAHFGSGVNLVEARVQGSDSQVKIRLGWFAQQPVLLDYTIFVHVEQDGNVVAQRDDGPFGGCHPMVGCYPMTHWRPGDAVVDELVLAIPRPWDPQRDQVWVGMYHWPELERVPITDSRFIVAEGRLRVFPSEPAPWR